MFGLLGRPKLSLEFRPRAVVASETAREIELAGKLILRNDGRREAEVTECELMLAAGSRRIDLAVPPDWEVGIRVPAGAAVECELSATQALAAPLRAREGELVVTLTERRGRRRQFRCPLTIEQAGGGWRGPRVSKGKPRKG